MAGTNPGTTDLVEWWTLDETSGNRVGSHASHTATDTNTVTYDTGKQGNAAKFTRANSETLVISDHADFDISGNFTLGCWLWTAGAAGSSDTGLWWKDGAYELQFGGTGGANDHKIYFYTNGGLRTTSTTAFNDSAWHFVICEYDGTNCTIYVDNSQDAQGAFSSAVTTNSNDVYIGTRNLANSYYEGLIDEMFLYARALSANEREWLYNDGDGRTYSDLSVVVETFIPKIIMF